MSAHVTVVAVRLTPSPVTVLACSRTLEKIRVVNIPLFIFAQAVGDPETLFQARAYQANARFHFVSRGILLLEFDVSGDAVARRGATPEKCPDRYLRGTGT